MKRGAAQDHRDNPFLGETASIASGRMEWPGLSAQAHEEAAEAFIYLLPCEVFGPGGSAPDRVRMGFVQTPGISLPLALLFFRGGVTLLALTRGPKPASVGRRHLLLEGRRGGHGLDLQNLPLVLRTVQQGLDPTFAP